MFMVRDVSRLMTIDLHKDSDQWLWLLCDKFQFMESMKPQLTDFFGSKPSEVNTWHVTCYLLLPVSNLSYQKQTVGWKISFEIFLIIKRNFQQVLIVSFFRVSGVWNCSHRSWLYHSCCCYEPSFNLHLSVCTLYVGELCTIACYRHRCQILCKANM